MDSFDLLLVADALRDFLVSRGLEHPRVAGLLASGTPLVEGMVAEVYVWPRQELSASDLARISREASEVAGWPVLLWAVAPGAEVTLPGERIAAL